MAGIADLKEAPPAWYGQPWKVVSGTDWEIYSWCYDGTGAAVPWTNCTATAKLVRSDGTVVKSINQTLTGGLQIDLTTAGRVVLRATPACTFGADDVNRPLEFNLLVVCTNPAVVIPIMQSCYIRPEPNLN